MIRAVVTDLDYTLLRADKTLSPYTAKVLHRLRQQGVRVACATARPMRTVRQLGLGPYFEGAVYHNGALVYDDGRLVAQAGINPADAAALVSGLAYGGEAVMASAECGDVLYANFDTTVIWPGLETVVTNLSALPQAPLDKLIFVQLTPQQRARLGALLPADLYHETNIEGLDFVMHRNATKLKGVGFLLERWGIPLADTAFFGDDAGDVELLAACGHGVAVANAVPAAKQAARHTCGHHNADGVAHWLEENLPVL